MQRNRAYTRWQRHRTISKKLGILKRLGGNENIQAWTKGAYGKLSKGKIHCSCPMCRQKSYDQLSLKDMKQKASAAQQIRGC